MTRLLGINYTDAGMTPTIHPDPVCPHCGTKGIEQLGHTGVQAYCLECGLEMHVDDFYEDHGKPDWCPKCGNNIKGRYECACGWVRP